MFNVKRPLLIFTLIQLSLSSMTLLPVNEFLGRKANHLTKAPILVMGNEAADMDSIVSALTYAYIQHIRDQSPTIPIINIPRSELVYRPEVVWLLKESDVNIDLLTFIDETNLNELCQNNNAKLQLTDHNRLCPTQSHLDKHVISVVDHHVDDNLYESATPRIIQPVGSACTLVTELWKKLIGTNPPQNIAKMLLSTILVDTINLDPVHKKVTIQDEEAALYLLESLGDPTLKTQLFERLQQEKYNTSHLTIEDSLRRDYKAFVFSGYNIGISSIMESAETLIYKDKENFIEICQEFAQKKSLDSLILGTAFYEGESFHREAVLIMPPQANENQQNLFQKLSNWIESSSDLPSKPLSVNNWSTPHNICKLFHLMDNTISRKKLCPLLQAALQN
eukprot:NODE_3133_length_1416_cov_55.463264_g2722_i0.p1 GENE.NODE_3133_length_1416_cov_55.463264_g2722_i0~~NODE_3133_length_1416_cov_55.463264_g2722_i0.p1  ORF type:complete len:393 (-),score=80.52 NODE_3133_length_1416_cov_55.463264_g2722_i0:192-1370(-)